MTIYKWIFPLKMVISHSYVSLPEGISGDSTQLEDSGPRAGPKGPKSRLSWLAVQEFFHHVSGEIKFTGSSWFTVVHHSISEFWMSEKSIKISPRTQIWCVCNFHRFSWMIDGTAVLDIAWHLNHSVEEAQGVQQALECLNEELEIPQLAGGFNSR